MRNELSVGEAAALCGIPAGEIDGLTKRHPNVARVLLEVKSGVQPEAAAARYDLPWIDWCGLDWQALA